MKGMKPDPGHGASPLPTADPSAIDMLVLAAVNAPYKRTIEAATLQHCLARADLDGWPVHIASFFTELSIGLVLSFADHHGIPRSKLAEAYLAMREKTGERNALLEAELVQLAPAAR